MPKSKSRNAEHVKQKRSDRYLSIHRRGNIAVCRVALSARLRPHSFQRTSKSAIAQTMRALFEALVHLTGPTQPVSDDVFIYFPPLAHSVLGSSRLSPQSLREEIAREAENGRSRIAMKSHHILCLPFE